MTAVVIDTIDFLLFAITIFWVARKPSTIKVSVMIGIVSIEQMGIAFVASAAEGLSVYEYYQHQMSAAMQSAEGAVGTQAGVAQEAIDFVASLWPSLFVIQAAILVFIAIVLYWGLCVLLKRKTGWSVPLSQVDLPIWTVTPVLVGLALYVAAILPAVQDFPALFAVACNVLALSIIPCTAQGVASSKGVMNQMGLSLGWQTCVALLGIFSGLALFVLPIQGLADYWANFRKLPRDGVAQG